MGAEADKDNRLAGGRVEGGMVGIGGIVGIAAGAIVAGVAAGTTVGRNA